MISVVKCQQEFRTGSLRGLRCLTVGRRAGPPPRRGPRIPAHPPAPAWPHAHGPARASGLPLLQVNVDRFVFKNSNLDH